MTDPTAGQGQSPSSRPAQPGGQVSGQRGEFPESYRDVAGRVVNCGFKLEHDEPAEPGSPFCVRVLRRASGTLAVASQVPELVLQRRLTHPPGGRDWSRSDMLDNEIRIGLHLIRAFGEEHYPAELPRVIGFDIDADEPFMLLLPYPGEQAAAAAGRLKLDEERSFEASLFRALRLLEVAGVVHGRIGPATVRWDKATSVVQITDFSRATLAGEPRRRAGQRPWSVAEQVAGTGLAETADDVWSAGQLVFHVATGRPVDPGGAAPNLSVRGAALETLLAGVFGPAPARPGGAELLGRLKQPDPWPWPVSAVDPGFAEGQRMFDEHLAMKFPGARQAPLSTPPTGSPRGPGNPPRRTPPKSASGFRRFLGPSLVAAFGLAASLIAATATSVSA